MTDDGQTSSLPGVTVPPFGRLVTAMVTPFDSAGELDLEQAATLATYLVDQQGNDGLVVSGTGGESATTTDEEKLDLLAAVIAAVGNRAHVVAGVGTFDTRHSIRLARDAAQAGADGLLVVTPYYSRPPQAGLIAHFRQITDATDLPMMLYDIPRRSGIPIETETFVELADHEQIVAVKDGKGDIAATTRVMAETDLAYYAGNDIELLPWLALGAVGLVGTSTHFSGTDTKALIDAFLTGDLLEARRLNQQLLPIYTGVFRTQAAILVKAGLRLRGIDAGAPRLPLIEASQAQRRLLLADLSAAGL